MGSDFTFKGYNDEPKPCQKAECVGMVQSTWNANIGKCDKCGEKYSWGSLLYVSDDLVLHKDV